jgi:hypothetical protein
MLTDLTRGALTVRVKALDVTPSIVTVSEWLPAWTAAVVLIVITVL